MRTYKLAKRYAKALFQSAETDSTLEKIHQQVRSLHELVLQSEEFTRYLRNPIISKENKKEILSKIFHNKLDPALFSFLDFLVEKERLENLEQICQAFHELYLRQKGIMEIKITSFAEMTKGQITHIIEKLKKHFQKEIIVHTQEDKGLLGGFKVQACDLIYDFTIKSQLKRFHQTIINA